MTIDYDKVAMEVRLARHEYDSLKDDIENGLGDFDYKELIEGILFEFQYDYDVLKKIRKAFTDVIENIYSE